MKRIYYSCKDINKFGDIAAKYILEKLTGEEHVWYPDTDEDTLFFGGSIMRETHRNAIVFGCGFGAADQVCKEKPKRIICVRGPLTRKMLIDQDIDCPPRYGDICDFLPYVYTPKTTNEYRWGIIPHYHDYESVKNADYFKDEKHLIIDITSGIENVIDEINRCSHIESGSLHGIIVSEIYHKPTTWVRFSDKIDSPNHFKYRDYYAKKGYASDFPFKKKPMDLEMFLDNSRDWNK